MDQQPLATFRETEEKEEKFKKEIGRGLEREREREREKIESELARKNEAEVNKLLLIHHTCSNKKQGRSRL